MKSSHTTNTPTALAVHRFAANRSQRSLAAAVGMSSSGLANLERGRSIPRPKTAQALSRELGIDVEVLFPKADLT